MCQISSDIWGDLLDISFIFQFKIREFHKYLLINNIQRSFGTRVPKMPFLSFVSENGCDDYSDEKKETDYELSSILAHIDISGHFSFHKKEYGLV